MSTMQIFRVLELPQVLVASGMYLIRNTTTGYLETTIVGADGTTVVSAPTKADILPWIEAYVPPEADKLSAIRNIAATGDAAWSVNFDGSADASAVLTLSASGVTAGEYAVVTVDAKGRVTAGRALTAADVPSLPGSKITSDITVNTSGNAATADEADVAVALKTARTINGVAFDGTQNITITTTDATERIAASEKGAANGVATLNSSGLITASQLPSYVDDVIEVDAFDKLPGEANDVLTNGAASTGKIYVVTTTVGATVTSTIYRYSGSMYIEIPSGVGTADSAIKLKTARSIAVTGDATWSVNFDGSENVTATMTLADTGVTAGVYGNLTIDSKGRVTAARALQESDIPSLTYTTVDSAASLYIEGTW